LFCDAGGLITISGGEPSLVKNIDILLDTNNKFYIFTNMSIIPDWYAHDNVLLIAGTFHEECISEKKFIHNALRVQESGKRIYAKLIVKPQKMISVELWEKLWSLGIPAHFTPLEYDYYFTENMIHGIRTKFLTSCMYNARFFWPPPGKIESVLCKAGTKEMFEISSKGIVGRCSSLCDISKNMLYNQPRLCSKNDCFCEWHHFASMARAEENDRWTRWIQTGRWTMPDQREFEEFLRNMHWDPRGRTKQVLEEYHYKLEIAKEKFSSAETVSL
jgi:hypothetical protein